jgi:hypothetical protein
MNRKLIFVTLLLAILCLGAPRAAWAGTFDEMLSAVCSYSPASTQCPYGSGAISDAEVAATLTEIATKGKLATDAQAQASYRGSFIDVVNAFAGSVITSDAAAALVQLAQQ